VKLLVCYICLCNKQVVSLAMTRIRYNMTSHINVHPKAGMLPALICHTEPENKNYQKQQNTTSGQRILMKGRIARLSPLMAVNGFIRHWYRLDSLAHKSPPHKWHLDQCSYSCRAHPCAKIPDLSHIASQTYSSDLDPHPIHTSLGPRVNPQHRLHRFSHFAGLTNMTNKYTNRSIICSRKTIPLNGFNIERFVLQPACYF